MITEIGKSIADLITNMNALGWSAWPALICIIIMIIVRQFAEDDVLDITTPDARKSQHNAKLISLAIGYIVSVIGYYGFDMPKGASDIAKMIVFSTLNVGLGYMSWSVYKAIDPIVRIKERFAKP